MPQWLSDWWSGLGEGNRRTAMILIAILVAAFLIAGFFGYQFQLLPGLLGGAP